MYKVVAIIKKHGASSRLEYAYVPSSWEQNGIVRWPNKNSGTLRKDANSKPEADWLKFKCKVKKFNLQQLDEAEIWEEELLNASCTEGEDSLSVAVSKKGILATPSIVTKNRNAYDLLFKEAIGYHAEEISEQNPVSIMYETVPIENDQQPEKVFSLSPEFCTSVSQELNGLKKKLNRMEEVYDKKFSQMQMTLDKIYVMLKDFTQNISHTSSMASSLTKQVLIEEFDTKFQFPLNNVESVKSFDSELSNKDFKDFMIQKLSTYGGTSGNESGKEVAKKIVVATFSKPLLTCFSWTGVSRTGGVEKKEPF